MPFHLVVHAAIALTVHRKDFASAKVIQIQEFVYSLQPDRTARLILFVQLRVA